MKQPMDVSTVFSDNNLEQALCNSSLENGLIHLLNSYVCHNPKPSYSLIQNLFNEIITASTFQTGQRLIANGICYDAKNNLSLQIRQIAQQFLNPIDYLIPPNHWNCDNFSNDQLLLALMGYSEIKDIPLSDIIMLLTQASSEGYTEVVKVLINSSRLNAIPKKVLLEKFVGKGSAFAKSFGHIEIDIPVEGISAQNFGPPLIEAARNGHVDIVKIFIHSDSFNEISIESIGKAVTYASENGHIDVVLALINSSRFNAIASKDFGLALVKT